MRPRNSASSTSHSQKGHPHASDFTPYVVFVFPKPANRILVSFSRAHYGYRAGSPLSIASGRQDLALHRHTLQRQLLSRLEMLDNNPATKAIVADGDRLYQLHSSGKIWRFTGTPCSGNSCPGWQMLDNNPATTAISAGDGRLFQLHNSGKIWRFTGMACSGNSCPGWQMLDNNPASKAIAIGGGRLYQLHTTGKIWRYTGTPCSGNSCPGWQMLDNNPATIAIVPGDSGAALSVAQ